MTNINWSEEVQKRESEILTSTQEFLKIKSVLDETTVSEGAPFGEGIAQALKHLLHKGEQDGFTVKNVDGYAGHIELGQGEDVIGILCHIDVVPEGDGWSVDPYGGEIKDGKIYARGAIDDKGPTMAAYYAMKIVKDLGVPLNKRVRMIIGTDEESNWQCVDHYFKHEEMPKMGFAPDADFPIINAEKGIADFDLVQAPSKDAAPSSVTLTALESGRRYNMVPDFAKAMLDVQEGAEDIQERFNSFLQEKQLQGKTSMDQKQLTLELQGVSAHGSVPEKGKNAGLLLNAFLQTIQLDEQGKQYVDFVNRYLVGDTLGQALEAAYRDDITGDLTINVGILRYSQEEGGKLGLNTRYPVTADIDKIVESIKSHSASFNMEIQNFSDSKPHHVDKNHPLIQTLQKVYTEQTGEEATLLAIGGGTYARALDAGVAFGPLFEGREELAHEKDEYMVVEDLLRATSIYAQAILELAK
ncbi:dipeptidase PepV [Priestia koreensis]|uniref:dipeptidase PepV n=1 Tax=Priestia koreensis TaxID=284581 RepID=UPI00203AA367|nr:dipeptidase PepV [Priestia koreensis]MCM3002852.1 dipeptidase PepV [Priestia koreensis]